MAKRLVIYPTIGVMFGGYVQRYGDSDTDSCSFTLSDTTPPILMSESFTNSFRHRALIRFDASLLPKYSRILSAKIRKDQLDNEMIRIEYSSNSPIFTNTEMEIYPANVKPWNENANCSTYDGTHSWDYFMMEPGYDYISGVKVVFSLEQDQSNTHLFRRVDDIDITSVIQELVYSDDYSKFDILFKLTDERENELIADLTNLSINRLSIEIEYDEPISFYGSDNLGNIDYTQGFGAGAGDAFNVGVLKIGATTLPKKVFVKNWTAIDFSNVKIYNRKSHASKQFEMVWNTSYDNRDWDVSTTDKSADNLNYTRDEWYKILFTTSTDFTVYRSSTLAVDPTQITDWTQVGTGTIGTQFVDVDRGVSFTLPTPTTSPNANDVIYFRTYQEDFVTNAPQDSIKCFEIAKDNSGSPDSFVPIRKGKAKIISVISSTQFQLDDIDGFYVGAAVEFSTRTTGAKSTATITSIDIPGKTIAVDTAQTVNVNDYVDVIPETFINSLSANQYAPFWVRGIGDTTQKEKKYALLRAEME